MAITICGMGIVSALGIGCAENGRALLAGQGALGENRLFATSLQVPVGAVPRSNTELKALLSLPAPPVSRTALLGALAAKEALAQAQIPAGKKVALISATTVGGMDLTEQFFPQYLEDNQHGDLEYVRGHDCATHAKLLAEMCGINGFCATISTACSSAANAIMMGARMLESNRCDYVVVGGSDALCAFTLNGFQSLMIVDKEPCRPFDRDRAGVTLGEGAAYLVMTREATTHSLGKLAGYANANDAFHQTATSEQGEGPYLAMKGALEKGGLTPSQIDYINLHGTGTPNNDGSEWNAISRLFGMPIPPMSSTKGFTGHTLAAAGAVEAVFALLALQHQTLWANLRFENPLAPNAIPVTETTAAPLQTVLSNSFGFGGNCSSLIFTT